MIYQSSRIIVLGAKSTGKTALVLRCLTGHFFPQPSTNTDTAYHFEYNGSLMDIVDSKGRNEALISYADGIVLVYSVTDRTSFVHLQTVLNKVRRLNFKDHLKIILVGTKNDNAKQRQVSLYEGQEFAVDNKCLFVETSASIPKQSTQVLNIFTQLLVKNNKYHNTLTRKKRRISSHDYDQAIITEGKTVTVIAAPTTTPAPASPTRKKSSNLYDSVRNFVQKKRRKSTSDQCWRHFENPMNRSSLNRELSKSMIVL